MEKILIFIWHFIFFAEGSCDNFKTDVILLIALIIVEYFRKNVFKNKLTRVYYYNSSLIWQTVTHRVDKLTS